MACLLPHFVGLRGDELVSGTVVGVRFVSAGPVGQGNITGTRGCDDSITFVNGFQFIEDLLRQG